MADIRCPECKRVAPTRAIDVKKVSDAVDEGKLQGAFYGSTGGYVYGRQGGYMLGSTGGAVTMVTALSQDLACPDPPTYQSPWGAGSIIGVICLIMMVIGGVFIGGFGLLFTLGVALRAQGTPSASSVNPAVIMLSFVQYLIFPVIAIVALVLIARSKAKTAALRKAVVARNTPLWHRARSIWDKLYYCPRCAGAYLPIGGRRLFYPDGAPVPEGVLAPRQQIRMFCRFP